jgi:hypothetical protein
MRRFMADLAAWLAIVVDATFVGVLMFFGRVVHPIFYGFAAFLSLASVAGGVWMWLTRDEDERDEDDTDDDDTDDDDTDDDQGGTTGGGEVTQAPPPVGKPARPRRPRSIRHWIRHPDQVREGVR